MLCCIGHSGRKLSRSRALNREVAAETENLARGRPWRRSHKISSPPWGVERTGSGAREIEQGKAQRQRLLLSAASRQASAPSPNAPGYAMPLGNITRSSTAFWAWSRFSACS